MGIKIRTGQAPNLPWYQLERMTDEEIKEFNNRYMHEEEMTNKPNDVTTEALLELERIAIWNTAIEAAAKELETYEYIEGSPDRIRTLKK